MMAARISCRSVRPSWYRPGFARRSGGLPLVKRFLTELAAGESEVERLRHEEEALRERITTFRAADRLPRENVHLRRA